MEYSLLTGQEWYQASPRQITNTVPPPGLKPDNPRKPSLPKFPCKQSEEEQLKQLCREGWKKRLIDGGKVDSEESKSEYLDRFEK